MRDASRIKPFLEQFEELWLLYPDLRFGQLISAINGDGVASEIFYMEDDEWLEKIKASQ